MFLIIKRIQTIITNTNISSTYNLFILNLRLGVENKSFSFRIKAISSSLMTSFTTFGLVFSRAFSIKALVLAVILTGLAGGAAGLARPSGLGRAGFTGSVGFTRRLVTTGFLFRGLETT